MRSQRQIFHVFVFLQTVVIVTAHQLLFDKVHEEAQAVVHGEEVEQSFRGHVLCLRAVDRLTMPEYCSAYAYSVNYSQPNRPSLRWCLIRIDLLGLIKTLFSAARLGNHIVRAWNMFWHLYFSIIYFKKCKIYIWKSLSEFWQRILLNNAHRVHADAAHQASSQIRQFHIEIHRERASHRLERGQLNRTPANIQGVFFNWVQNIARDLGTTVT